MVGAPAHCLVQPFGEALVVLVVGTPLVGGVEHQAGVDLGHAAGEVLIGAGDDVHCL